MGKGRRLSPSIEKLKTSNSSFFLLLLAALEKWQEDVEISLGKPETWNKLSIIILQSKGDDKDDQSSENDNPTSMTFQGWVHRSISGRKRFTICFLFDEFQ